MAENGEQFRDAISTVDKKGKRVWIFPKKPFGPWYNKRKIVSYLLLLLLFGGPYIKIGGEPLLLLNFIERKFVIFGFTFWPQDLHLFAIAMVTFVVFVTLFTVVYGRLFCGWVCPQTIFMEMLFRRIEYAIEGDWTHQKRLKASPWTTEKIIKKTSKHVIFWIISFLIANTFLAYIIGYEELFTIITDNPANHVGGLISIAIFTTIFYLVFAKMREQVCTVVCPYGRLQGVLLDRNSMVVAYDHERGENRAKFKKTEDRTAAGKGDCIDCGQCVHVCPTGIDIRNGTQLECVNCTACIDACDHIMENVGMPKGLIRYASEEGIVKGTPFRFTNRIKAYTVVLVALIGLLGTIIILRSDFESTVLRTRGTLFQEMGDNQYSNIYDITIVNKTNKGYPIKIELMEGEGEIKQIGKDLFLPERGEVKGKFMIVFNTNKITKVKTNCKIGIYGGEKLIETASTTFVGPMF